MSEPGRTPSRSTMPEEGSETPVALRPTDDVASGDRAVITSGNAAGTRRAASPGPGVRVTSEGRVQPPEPEAGTILLATTDARVWVRTIFAWNSTKGWFGWSWKQLLDEYGTENLMLCTVGPTIAEQAQEDAHERAEYEDERASWQGR